MPYILPSHCPFSVLSRNSRSLCIEVVCEPCCAVVFRAATAALVEKQSSEMLELINEKRSEYMMAESLYLDDSAIPDETAEALDDNVQPYPGKAPLPPSPHGVAQAKFQLYSDPLEFAHIDQIAISVRYRQLLSP